MKKTYVFFLIVIFMTSVLGCTHTNIIKSSGIDNESLFASDDSKDEKDICLKIITTDKVMYYMVKDIVGDRHNVDYMFNNEAEIWDYAFSGDSTENMSTKDLFIYSGAGLEPWVDDFTDEVTKGKVGIINASRGIKLLTLTNEKKYKNTSVKDNPYYWLDIDNYKVALLNIKNSILERDPKNRDIYDAAFSKSIKNIGAYEKKLKELSDKLKDYAFVLDTDDTDYFVKFAGFKTIKINNMEKMSPSEKAAELEKIDKKLKEAKKIVFIYSDSQQLTRNQDIILKYNMKTVNIDVYGDSKNYLDLLAYNIVNLQSLVTQ